MEELGPLKLLYMVLLGFGIMLGICSKKKIGKVIAGLIITPVLISIVLGIIKSVIK